MVGWRFMPYIIFFIYLIIYKRILACSTSTVYKSPGFFSSFSLIFFFLKQLGATEKKKKSRYLKLARDVWFCKWQERVTHIALQKPALEIIH